MRKNLLLLLLAAMFTMVSCNYNEDQVTVNTTEADQEVIVDGKVPLSRAITNADFVFKNIEGASLKNRKVKSVDVLTTSNSNSVIANTRSGLGEQEQPVAYVVNYENNEGFAILAADTKLPPVIGIGDEGNFNTQGFIDFVQNNATRTGSSELNPAQEVQYAVINNSLLLPPTIGDIHPVNCTDTTIVLKCMPLVRTKWGQREPYNYYAPLDPEDDSKVSDAGCGPVAATQILAALCFHHNWRPNIQLSNQYSINWYAINKMIYDGVYYFFPDDYSSRALAVASLIRAFGEAAESEYSYHEGTDTYLSKIRSVYTELGLIQVRTGNQDSSPAVTRNKIFDMILNKNYPVMVRADNSYSNEKVGHFFIIDGWLRLEYSVISSDIIGPGLENPAVFIDTTQLKFDLVHINLGWKGSCDGYYLPDAFDLTKKKYEEYAELNDYPSTSQHVYDLNIGYTVYDMP